MNTINANDLKVGGVTAIESALQSEPEAAISVRGERRFVVMNMAHYEHLRECELEAAWLSSQADRAAGRVRSMTAAQHIADMQKQLKTPAGTLAVQQERSAYASESATTVKAPTARTPRTTRQTRNKPTVKISRRKAAQSKAR